MRPGRGEDHSDSGGAFLQMVVDPARHPASLSPKSRRSEAASPTSPGSSGNSKRAATSPPAGSASMTTIGRCHHDARASAVVVAPGDPLAEATATVLIAAYRSRVRSDLEQPSFMRLPLRK